MKILVRGQGTGPALVSARPINFLGMVNKNTGVIEEPSHPLNGRSLAGVVLLFPGGVGSSVGAYTIYSIKSHDAAPAAMICSRADLTVATGCAASGIPLVAATESETAHIETGMNIHLDAGRGVIRIL